MGWGVFRPSPPPPQQRLRRLPAVEVVEPRIIIVGIKRDVFRAYPLPQQRLRPLLPETVVTPGFIDQTAVISAPIVTDQTVTTVFADAVDGYIESVDTVYANARAGGTPITAFDTATFGLIGQALTGADYYCEETFLSFDTSSIPDGDVITSAVLSLYGERDNSDTNFTLEVAAFDWGASVTTADWQDGTELGAHTVIATFNSAGWSLAGYNEFTEVSGGLAAAINKTGTTRLVVFSSQQRIPDNAPSGDEYVGAFSADETGTSKDPKLVITHIDLSQTVTAGLINQTAVISTPVVTPGGVSVTPGLINQTAVISAPTVQPGGVTVSPDLINQTAVPFAPEIQAGAFSLTAYYVEDNVGGSGKSISVPGVTWQATDLILVFAAMKDADAQITGATVAGLTFRTWDADGTTDLTATLFTASAEANGSGTIVVTTSDTGYLYAIQVIVVHGLTPTVDDVGTASDTSTAPLTAVDNQIADAKLFSFLVHHGTGTFTNEGVSEYDVPIRENDQIIDGAYSMRVSVYHGTVQTVDAWDFTGTLSASDDWITFAVAVSSTAPQLIEVEPIDQTGQIFDIDVGFVVSPGLINQTAVISAPTVHLGVAIPLIDQTAVPFSPVIGLTFAAPFIDRTADIFAPEVIPDQVVTIGLISQSPTLFDVTVNQSVELGLIDQTAVIFDPVVVSEQLVTVGLIDQTTVVTAPVVAITGELIVSTSLIDQTAVISDPVLASHVSVDLALIDQTAVATTPVVSITGEQVVSTDLIDQTAVISAPVVASEQTVVLVDLIDQTAVITAPVVAFTGDQVVSTDLLNQSAVISQPVVAPGGVSVTPDLINQTGVLFSPQLDLSLDLDLINQTANAWEPVVSAGAQTVTVDALIDQTAVLHGISVLVSDVSVEPSLIDQQAVAFAFVIPADQGPRGAVTVSDAGVGGAGVSDAGVGGVAVLDA